MNRIKKTIIFVILLLIFLSLFFLFNIYKRTNNYKSIIKNLEIFLNPLLNENKNKDIVYNRLKSYENIQKDFWIKNSLNDIREKGENDEATINQYLEKALILSSVNKKDQAKEILKDILLEQTDEGSQKDAIYRIKEKMKTQDNKITSKSENSKEDYKDKVINYELVEMLFEEILKDQEIGIAKELYIKKEEIKNTNINKTINKNKSIEKKMDEQDNFVSTSFYNRLKSSDEVKEFINKGQDEEEYNIVLEVLDNAYKDKFISLSFYNKSREFIVKKIEDASKIKKEELADTEKENRNKLVKNFNKEEKNNNNLIEKEDQTDNLIKDGKFSKVYYWTLWADNKIYPKYYVIDSVAIIDISKNISDSRIDFYQGGLKFEKGTDYMIKFQAKASILKDVMVVMQHMQGDWTIYYEMQFRLTKEMKEYEFIFRMRDKTDNNGRLVFMFNYEKGKIYISDVEMKKQ